jgi:hypothetical protein
MEMEKSYFVVSFKPAYFKMLQEKSGEGISDETGRQRVIIAITQGGFGQDVVDDEQQAKQRFLEYLFYSSDVDLPRTTDVFDEYFELDPASELIDLDE